MGKAKVLQHTLPNKLHLIGEYSPDNQSAGIGFFVRTGSRDETPREAGVSHFLEHMMFKGTPRRSAIDLTFEMGNIGAQANAYTTEENTVYYAVVLPEYMGEMHDILADMLRPSLDQEEFDTEKKVILEEIALYQDRPQFYLFEKAMGDYFGGHPAGNSVLGTTESITRVTRDEMANYFERRYSPSNMVMVVTGRFDWDAVREATEKLSGGWVDFPAARTVSPYSGSEKRLSFKKPNIQQSHLLLLSEGPSAQEEERFALSLLSMILGDSTGSKLYWELIQPGLADGATADVDERDGTGCFYTYVSADPNNMEQIAEKVRAILAAPLEFSDADLQRAQNKLISRIVSSGELPMGRLMALGTEWLYRREIHSLSDTIQRLRAVDRNAIGAALERFPLKVWSEYRLTGED